MAQSLAPTSERRGRPTKIKSSMTDRVFIAFNYMFGTLCMLIVAYPIWYVVIASFSMPAAVTSGKVWLWPSQFTLMCYETIMKFKDIPIGYGNSIYYAITGTVVAVSLTLCAAYPLSRRGLVGRSVFTTFFFIPMLFSGGLIPTYLLISKLGLLDSRLSIILPGSVGAFNIIIMRTYFQSNLPSELYDATEIDGCSDFRFMWRFLIPLSGPIIAVVVLYSAVGYWNSYFSALIYLQDGKKYPLQLVLRSILIQNQMNAGDLAGIEPAIRQQRQQLVSILKYSVIVVASVPLMLLYPFVQKYFIHGVMIGSVKG